MSTETASPAKSNRQRQSPRRPVYIWGTVRPLGYASEKLLVLNLSKSGLMGETERDIPEGRFIEIVLPGTVPLMAKVVWTCKGRVGAKFMRAI